MKTFVFTRESRPTTYCNKLTFTVYRVKNNTPIHIGVVTANSGAYRGDESAVMNYLISEKLLPKKNYGYYRESTNNFRIHRV